MPQISINGTHISPFHRYIRNFEKRSRSPGAVFGCAKARRKLYAKQLLKLLSFVPNSTQEGKSTALYSLTSLLFSPIHSHALSASSLRFIFSPQIVSNYQK